MSDSNAGLLRGAMVSGLISTVVGVGVVLVLSFVLPFPWSQSQTLVSVALAAFCGSAVGFSVGRTLRTS
jgi:hypothetical protein